MGKLETNFTVSALLGITQFELGMLLRVHPSQISMFESGLRDLPLASKQLLAEALVHVQTRQEDAKQVAHEAKQVYKKEQIECLLRKNENHRLEAVRKVTAAEKKNSSKERLLQILDFLDNHKSNEVRSGFAYEPLTRKAIKAKKTDSMAALVAAELKLEMLENEKILLESKVLEVTKGIELKENE
jgi:transcriptional regulator with XRE-family HTH domain